MLFTNYEAQVAALLEGHVDVAWNGPVAHVAAEDLAAAAQREGGRDVALVQSCGMRDVDRDFRSVALVRRDRLPDDADGGAGQRAEDVLAGATVATGASDSPQGHLVPVDWLVHARGVKDATIVPHDVDLGKHGDTAAGEVEALKALLDGSGGTSAALVSEMMYRRGLDGALDGAGVGAARLRESVARLRDAPPAFDHCSFDALVGDHPSDNGGGGASRVIEAHRAKVRAFSRAVRSMDMNDPRQAPVMKLEGIRKSWMGPRVDPDAFSSWAPASRGCSPSGPCARTASTSPRSTRTTASGACGGRTI